MPGTRIDAPEVVIKTMEVLAQESDYLHTELIVAAEELQEAVPRDK